MTQMSDAYRKTMIAKGIENRRLRLENAAFGGYRQRLEAMYGNFKSEEEPGGLSREPGHPIRGLEKKSK